MACREWTPLGTEAGLGSGGLGFRVGVGVWGLGV